MGTRDDGRGATSYYFSSTARRTAWLQRNWKMMMIAAVCVCAVVWFLSSSSSSSSLLSSSSSSSSPIPIRIGRHGGIPPPPQQQQQQQKEKEKKKEERKERQQTKQEKEEVKTDVSEVKKSDDDTKATPSSSSPSVHSTLTTAERMRLRLSLGDVHAYADGFRADAAPKDSHGKIIPLGLNELRSATIETIVHTAGQTDIAWHLADIGKEIGVVLLFHGCGGHAHLWFELPEHRANVRALVSNGFSVLAFSSLDRRSKCWDDTWPSEYALGTRQNVDIVSVLGVLQAWLHREDKEEMPLFAFGASSGGTFVSLLSRAMYLHGSVIMISPGDEKPLLTLPAVDPVAHRTSYATLIPPLLDPKRLDEAKSLFNLPPLAFIFMPRDQSWATTRVITYHRSVILGNNGWLDSSNVGLHDRLPLWTVEPKPWTKETLLTIEEIAKAKHGVECSYAFFLAAKEPHAELTALPRVDPTASGATPQPPPPSILDADTNMVSMDPRRVRAVRLVRDVMLEAESGARTFKTGASPFASLDTKEEKANGWTECARLVKENERPIEELLNSYYATHEMTSQYADQTAAWLKQLLQDESDPRLAALEATFTEKR